MAVCNCKKWRSRRERGYGDSDLCFHRRKREWNIFSSVFYFYVSSVLEIPFHCLCSVLPVVLPVYVMRLFCLIDLSSQVKTERRKHPPPSVKRLKWFLKCSSKTFIKWFTEKEGKIVKGVLHQLYFCWLIFFSAFKSTENPMQKSWGSLLCSLSATVVVNRQKKQGWVWVMTTIRLLFIFGNINHKFDWISWNILCQSTFVPNNLSNDLIHAEAEQWGTLGSMHCKTL